MNLIRKYWDQFELRPESERQTWIEPRDYDISSQLTQPQRQKNMGLIIRIMKEYFDEYLLEKKTKDGKEQWTYTLDYVDDEIWSILSIKQSETNVLAMRMRIVTFLVMERLCKAYQ